MFHFWDGALNNTVNVCYYSYTQFYSPLLFALSLRSRSIFNSMWYGHIDLDGKSIREISQIIWCRCGIKKNAHTLINKTAKKRI